MSTENVQQAVDSNCIIVIHPGSLYVRIGRASDNVPQTVLHAIARKKNYPDISCWDFIIPPIVSKKEETEAQMDQCRLQLSYMLQSCLSSDGQRRYATPPQQIFHFNRQAVPEITSYNVFQYTKFETDTIIGDDIVNIDIDSGYNLHFPIKRGDLNIHKGVGGSITAIMADLNYIWTWIIENKLNIPKDEFKNYKAVLVIPDIYNRSHIPKYLNILYEMGFSACFFIQDHVAATFGAGVSAACVIDCGHGKTSVSCVEDGLCQPQTRVRLPYGGGDISQTLLWLMNKCAFPYKECNIDNIVLDAMLLENLKKNCCHLNLDVCGCHEKTFEIRRKGKPLFQYTIQVADEGIIAPLGVFAPELFGFTGPKNIITQEKYNADSSDPFDTEYLNDTGRKKEIGQSNMKLEVHDEIEIDFVDISGDTEFIMGPSELLSLDQAILQSIQKCDTDEMKKKMFSCILLVGGGMKFDGVTTWIRNKINLQVQAIHKPDQIDVITQPKDFDPQITVWKGAAVAACMETSQELWITKSEWNIHGVKILRERASFIW